MSPKSGNQPLVYDENLLAQAPEVTQGQRQEGYDADILNPTPPLPSRTPASTQPYRDHPDVESGSSAHDKHLAAGGYDHVGQPTKKPFWKTSKGVITLAILAIVVVGIVVGVPVGVVVGKNKDKGDGLAQNSTDPSTTPNSTNSTSSALSSGSATPGSTNPIVSPGTGTTRTTETSGNGGGGGGGGGGETAGTPSPTPGGITSPTSALDGPGVPTPGPSPSNIAAAPLSSNTQTPGAPSTGGVDGL
ncbi:hypothetical protein RSOLAG1IB_09164 [Rhizoctonia solani AG-1 IB]|uniref:Uncharacterized protein n=2 Tax=Rhizoctonia solani TaxID=456999 RepID=M5BSL2_THACB|nr:unnamed protein product [Rhizoctonia solani]CCO30196.1 hypothetical protein BN14_04220 [Rhizoctonia solani AG-1 IB]CEL59187.1 hypothetical protein RSOLAG1IB_09164 [Rhizoctonia solani AG-1 IB]